MSMRRPPVIASTSSETEDIRSRRASSAAACSRFEPAGEAGHALPHPDEARGPARSAADQPRDPLLGRVGLRDQRPSRCTVACGLEVQRLAMVKMPFVGLDLDRDLGRAAGMGLQRLDLLVVGAVRLEEQRLDRVEQRRLAVLVRLAQDVQPVADAGDAGGRR